MGWRIERKDNKFRIWSTVVDDWITKRWLDREEVLAVIEKSWKDDLEYKIEQERKNFPQGWFTIDGKMLLREAGGEK